ncbi:MAG: hypothetical protein GXO29_03045 [Thermotogae bacterium]|nr:hypothetical protein [Thermotogota bacterium]
MIEAVLRYVEERFGIPREIFNGFRFFSRGRDVWIVSEDVPELKHINRMGLRFARGGAENPKLTTAVIQIFGRHATRNTVSLDDEQLSRYLRGEDVEVGEVPGVERGQVIVMYGEDALGSGLYDGRRVKNQIPKARRIVSR